MHPHERSPMHAQKQQVLEVHGMNAVCKSFNYVKLFLQVDKV